MFVLDDKFYNGHLGYFNETKELRFQVKGISNDQIQYKIKVQIQAQAELQAGKSYLTRVDVNMKEIQVLFSYKNDDTYEKIRFQVIALKHDKDSLLNAHVTDN